MLEKKPKKPNTLSKAAGMLAKSEDLFFESAIYRRYDDIVKRLMKKEKNLLMAQNDEEKIYYCQGIIRDCQGLKGYIFKKIKPAISAKYGKNSRLHQQFDKTRVKIKIMERIFKDKIRQINELAGNAANSQAGNNLLAH